MKEPELIRLPISLHPAEQFDPAAFVGANEGEQRVCDFVLSLAWVYNDFKDLSWASYHLNLAKSATREYGLEYDGERTGMSLHVQRLVIGLFHELFDLIEDNSAALKHPLFTTLYSSLNSKVREQWDDLVAIANRESSKAKTTFRQRLDRIRNTAAYHYRDTRSLGKTFMNYFSQGEFGPPAVSRGTNLYTSRFYFIDPVLLARASQLARGDASSTEDFASDMGQVMTEGNAALRQIVERFINGVRKAAWSPYSPPATRKPK